MHFVSHVASESTVYFNSGFALPLLAALPFPFPLPFGVSGSFPCFAFFCGGAALLLAPAPSPVPAPARSPFSPSSPDNAADNAAAGRLPAATVLVRLPPPLLPARVLWMLEVLFGCTLRGAVRAIPSSFACVRGVGVCVRVVCIGFVRACVHVRARTLVARNTLELYWMLCYNTLPSPRCDDRSPFKMYCTLYDYDAPSLLLTLMCTASVNVTAVTEMLAC